jgi:hypothetical protein
MVETTLGVGDLITAIPDLHYQLQKPITCIMLAVGAVVGFLALYMGVGHAAGKVIGGIAFASLIFGGLSLAHSSNYTVNVHGFSGPVMNDTGYIPWWVRGDQLLRR